jgi:hypothetical protein
MSPRTGEKKMKTCEGFDQLMKWQASQMAKAIEEDRWYLSEKGGVDVGFKTAEKHFREEHLDRCATDWRRRYCGVLCECKAGCELGRAMLEKEES